MYTKTFAIRNRGMQGGIISPAKKMQCQKLRRRLHLAHKNTPPLPKIAYPKLKNK